MFFFPLFFPNFCRAAETIKHCKRIVVIGTSGSGKTTLANEIAKVLDTQVIDLDDLYWLPEWSPKDQDLFLKDVEKAVQAPSWVIAGNQGKARHLIWPKADCIIWLDFPLSTCLWRVFKRSCFNIWNHTPICNGNYDSLSREFSKDSIVLWVLNTHAERKKKLEACFQNPQPDTLYLRLSSPAEVKEVVDAIHLQLDGL